MGEVANQETLDRIVAILKNHKSVNRYRIPKSMHLGPESILVVVELDLADDLDFSSAKGLLKKFDRKSSSNVRRLPTCSFKCWMPDYFITATQETIHYALGYFISHDMGF